MPDPARPETIDEKIKAMRERGEVPLGVFSYGVEHDEFILYSFPDVSHEEVSALFEKLRLRFRVLR